MRQTQSSELEKAGGEGTPIYLQKPAGAVPVAALPPGKRPLP